MTSWKDTKLTQSWGEDKAERLWKASLSPYPIDWAGKTFLDFGCSWGYLCKYLVEHQGVAQAYGVDIEPMWLEMRDGTDPAALPNLHLYAGDLLELPELQDVRFDVLFSAGTLMLIRPTELHEILSWFYDHLVPGGACVLNVRTFLSQYGGDLQSWLGTELPHLLFSKRTIDRYMTASGHPPSRYMNPSCAATYLTLFRRVGFEIVQADRIENTLEESVYEDNADKLWFYDGQELRTSMITAFLRRPSVPADLSELGGGVPP